MEAHKEVFARVVKILKEEGLLKGRKIGVDATNLEADAAMRSTRRKIDGKRYTAYVQKLAEESARAEASREKLARLDRNRADKSCSNQEWENPNDPDAKVAKMKEGRTHSAYKAEHAMDLMTGAIVSAVIQPADRGDTETVWETVAEAAQNLRTVQEDGDPEEPILEELVADKGHHSNSVPVGLGEAGVRSSIAEPERGRRRWRGKPGARQRRAVYENRRRIRRARGASSNDGEPKSWREASHTCWKPGACAGYGSEGETMSGSAT